MRVRLAAVTMTALVAIGLVTARPAAGDPINPKTIPVVVLDNGSGIAPKDLAAAQAIAARVLGRVGVGLVWFTHEEFFRDQPADLAAAQERYRSLIYVVVANRTEADAAGSDGSVMGKTRGHFVRVFPTRVREIALHVDVPIADLLGHVIAHELGHVLLGPGAHAPSGIMQAALDLKWLRVAGLWFSASEARAIHERLARR